jgi:hypothetical protein
MLAGEYAKYRFLATFGDAMRMATETQRLMSGTVSNMGARPSK